MIKTVIPIRHGIVSRDMFERLMQQYNTVAVSHRDIGRWPLNRNIVYTSGVTPFARRILSAWDRTTQTRTVIAECMP